MYQILSTLVILLNPNGSPIPLLSEHPFIFILKQCGPKAYNPLLNIITAASQGHLTTKLPRNKTKPVQSSGHFSTDGDLDFPVQSYGHFTTHEDQEFPFKFYVPVFTYLICTRDQRISGFVKQSAFELLCSITKRLNSGKTSPRTGRFHFSSNSDQIGKTSPHCGLHDCTCLEHFVWSQTDASDDTDRVKLLAMLTGGRSSMHYYYYK